MEKAGTRKPAPKTKPKLTDKEQSERFRETARKLGAEATSEQFEKMFGKMGPRNDLRGNRPLILTLPRVFCQNYILLQLLDAAQQSNYQLFGAV